MPTHAQLRSGAACLLAALLLAAPAALAQDTFVSQPVATTSLDRFTVTAGLTPLQNGAAGSAQLQPVQLTDLQGALETEEIPVMDAKGNILDDADLARQPALRAPVPLRQYIPPNGPRPTSVVGAQALAPAAPPRCALRCSCTDIPTC